MVGLGLGRDVLLFGPRLGPGLPGRGLGFGSGFMLGPEPLALLHGGEVQIAITMPVTERAVETVLQDDTVLGPDPLSLLL